jgi:hypothetical protein
MPRKACAFAAIALAMSGCGGADDASERAGDRSEPTPRRETVFDPTTSTIGRAQGVQQTVDAQAAEQRKRIEDAER